MQVTKKLCDVVVERVEAVDKIAYDDEAAHRLEDQLWVAVLLHIARGKCYNPRRCSRVALKTQNINFSRWCA